MFATVAIAALFASCSSSDDFVAPKAAAEDVSTEEGLVPIQIGVAQNFDVSATRGTGTVGAVGGADGDSHWNGQLINVFMFNKGTLDLATEKDGTGADVPLFDNQLMITPGTGNAIPGSTAPTHSGQAMIWDLDASSTSERGVIKYYPQMGNFDFFGYHGDDAITTKPTKNTAGDAFEVPFKINGSQDLMSTKAIQSTTTWPNGDDDNKTRFFSAYSGRRGIHPNLAFDHLLTRLQFNIKAGDESAAGVKVTGYKLNGSSDAPISVTAYNAIKTQADYSLFYLNDDGITTATPSEYSGFDDTTKAKYTAQYTADGGATMISATAWAALYADAEAKAAAYTEVKSQDLTPATYTGVKVTSVEIFSRTTGKLITAWTSGAGIQENPSGDENLAEQIRGQKIKWDDLVYSPSDPSANTCGWVALKQRPASGTDLEALAAVAPDYAADAEDKFPLKTIGEALIVSKPVAVTLNSEKTEVVSATGDGDSYSIKITLEQQVLKNHQGATLAPKSFTSISSFKAPENETAFKLGYSYNVNLVLYGAEEIKVFTTIAPWSVVSTPVTVEVE